MSVPDIAYRGRRRIPSPRPVGLFCPNPQPSPWSARAMSVADIAQRTRGFLPEKSRPRLQCTQTDS
eukprot:1084883-Rhodomonas_salina.1